MKKTKKCPKISQNDKRKNQKRKNNMSKIWKMCKNEKVTDSTDEKYCWKIFSYSKMKVFNNEKK